MSEVIISEELDALAVEMEKHGWAKESLRLLIMPAANRRERDEAEIAFDKANAEYRQKLALYRSQNNIPDPPILITKEDQELRFRCMEAAAQIMRGTGYRGAGGSEWDRTDKNVIELASALLYFVQGRAAPHSYSTQTVDGRERLTCGTITGAKILGHDDE